jgi:hypothetical protein
MFAASPTFQTPSLSLRYRTNPDRGTGRRADDVADEDHHCVVHVNHSCFACWRNPQMKTPRPTQQNVKKPKIWSASCIYHHFQVSDDYRSNPVNGSAATNVS